MKQNNESAIKVAVSEDFETIFAKCDILDDNQALVIKGGRRAPAPFLDECSCTTNTCTTNLCKK